MKYLFITLAVIVLIVIAFGKGVSVGADQDDLQASSCSPESILKAENPDARFSHCKDQDWNGSTFLQDRLAEARNHPQEYQILYTDNQVRFALVPYLVQPEVAEPLPQPVSVAKPVFELVSAHP
jgi:hypothetical protein